jgi:DNA invertase Pin-like site-specific DNA recombinase
MDAAVYLRQSLDRDNTQMAVSRQREDCLKLCDQRGWTPVEYLDNSLSASNGKHRPAYKRMLADIREGKVQAVVTWDLDRLHRQPRELEDFIDLADTHRLALATVTGDCDLATDNGRLYARIKGAVGKGESERKAARQRRAGRQKAEHGRPQWKRAFGYLPGADGPMLDPKTAPLVKEAYAAVIAGSSLADITRIFNDAGAYGLNGQPWALQTLSLFLRSPRNAGLREYSGKILEGVKATWPPLVSESTWRAAQAVMTAPGRKPGPKTVRRHLLSGILRCGKKDCGGYLGAMRTNTKAVTYVCKGCHGVSIRAAYVEPFLYRTIGERLAEPDARDLLLKEIQDEAEAEALRLRVTELDALLKAANAEYDRGVIDGERLAGRTAYINEELVAIDLRQQDHDRRRVLDGIPVGTPEAADALLNLSDARFRAVLDVFTVVTIAAVGKGRGKVFQPERVDVQWR